MHDVSPSEALRASVRDYYGRVLGGSTDLATNACCAAGAPPAHVAAALANIHPDVEQRFYGCGFPIPHALAGASVLDLGCGTGRDVFVLAQLVGAHGRVVGLDMTTEQLAWARGTEAWHAERFGYAEPNTRFVHGYVEDLAHAGLEAASFDVVVSNCVVNLSPRKDLVLAEAHRVLRDGGELYFSDVFADRRLRPELAREPKLHAECLGGAMHRPDFLHLARRVGFTDPRVVSVSPIVVGDPELGRLVGAARFESVTYRLFKLPGLDPECEDYGQVATYRGSLEDTPDLFWLDDHHAFERGRPERVCRNTARMLAETRFGTHFDVTAPAPAHFGSFPCGPTMAAAQYARAAAAVGACC